MDHYKAPSLRMSEAGVRASGDVKPGNPACAVHAETSGSLHKTAQSCPTSSQLAASATALVHVVEPGVNFFVKLSALTFVRQVDGSQLQLTWTFDAKAIY